jgi:carbon monoxide dehydrogenase subunit G
MTVVSVQRTVDVARSPQDVAAYLADFANAVDWDPGTVSCTRVDDGPVAVGAQWRNVSRFLGRTVELDYRLITWTDDHVVLEGRNGEALSRDDIVIAPQGSGSRLSYRATITLGCGARLLAPLLRLPFERIATKTAAQLARSIDRG